MTESPGPSASRLPLWAAGLVLAALTAALYWPVHGFDFINYDDPDYVLRNPYITPGVTQQGLAWAFGRLHGFATYWHPLTWVSHMIDCQLFGLAPGPHHLGNVALHTLNTVLLFLLLYRLTRDYWPCVIAAALFAWHPLQVDTVAWVSERKNVLAGCFWFLTLLAYVRYTARPGVTRYLLALLPFVLGLMCKPVLVTLPCVMLLLDWWPLRRLRPGFAELTDANNPVGSSSAGRLVGEKIPFFALAAASCVITMLGHHGLGMGETQLSLPLSGRIAHALVSYARYLGKVVWPVDLSIVYLHPGGWPPAAVLAAAALLIVITALTWRVRRQIPAVAVGWLWFLGVLVPFIGIVQAGIQAMADRFAYLPIVGLFIAGVWGGRELARRAPPARLALGVTAGLVCAASWLTASLQLRHWRNSVTLFRHAVAVDPENFIAQNNLALALSLEGKLDEALVHVQQALRINPGTARPHNLCASILEQQGKLTDALIHYQIASHLSPTWALAHLGAGRMLAALGRREQAIPPLRQALRFSPGDPEASALLAEQLAAEGQTAEAIQAYRTALQWSEDQPPVLNNLAWILATHPQAEFRQGHEAVRLAERACALSGRQVPLYLGTLAAAYAETSQFEQAVRTAREAHDKAAAAGQPELAARNAELLRHYETFRPYRQAMP